MSDLDDYLAVARAAVDAAAAHLRVAVTRPQRIEHKGAIDLVTETDHAVEALVGERLRRAFPDHLIVGEEAAAGRRPARPPADRLAWYLDPLDGTTNFAHGHPHFAVSLALARGAEPLLGLVADPLRGETFAAVRGGGATCNGAPIRVATTPALDGALLGTGTPYDRRQRRPLPRRHPRLHAALPGHPPRRLGGARPVLACSRPARCLLGVAARPVGRRRRGAHRARGRRRGERLRRRRARRLRRRDPGLERPPARRDARGARPRRQPRSAAPSSTISAWPTR
ncbi:MAG: inositol monophosphatase family protein [Candidatus Binatia bacterium]